MKFRLGMTVDLKLNIFRWLDEHKGDPALKTFFHDVKVHLLSRLLGHASDGLDHAYMNEELDAVEIVNNDLYCHKVMYVNYTTYDVRRSQDSMNPRTHPDIMMLDDNSTGTAHPYAYAQVLGIFHVELKHHGPQSTTAMTHRMELLWVRWFEVDSSYAAGWNARRLDRIFFADTDSPNVFGFVDPIDVIRGAHLIAAFVHGCTDDLLGPSIARQFPNEGCFEDEDWAYCYVNRFVDRDMFVRYLGGGVGQISIKQYTQSLHLSFIEANEQVADDDQEEDLQATAAPEEGSEEEEDEDDKGEGKDDDDYEGEDGEEPWEMNDGEAEGYADY